MNNENNSKDSDNDYSIDNYPSATHINATKFPTLYFQNITKDGSANHVVILKITYNMSHESTGRLIISEQQMEIFKKDRWQGKINESSLVWESDVVPRKIKCDLIIANGYTQQDDSKNTFNKWICGFELIYENNVFKKFITATSQRIFTTFGIRHITGSKNEKVSLDWSKAYGGQIKTPPEDEIKNEKIVKAGEKKWETEKRNPVGVGLNRGNGCIAPQLEEIGNPYSENNENNPVSFNPVGKSWIPRRYLAGTYDERWKKEQWPLPPFDFKDEYWNGAPLDQQVPYIKPESTIILYNIFGLFTESNNLPNPLKITIPKILPKLNLRHVDVPGYGVDVDMNLDTLIINLESGQIYATYRYTTPVTIFSSNLQLTTHTNS